MGSAGLSAPVDSTSTPEFAGSPSETAQDELEAIAYAASFAYNAALAANECSTDTTTGPNEHARPLALPGLAGSPSETAQDELEAIAYAASFAYNAALAGNECST